MTPTYEVLFERRARDQLVAIERWIAERAGVDTAQRIADDLIDRCLALAHFPERGSPRDDVRRGRWRIVAGIPSAMSSSQTASSFSGSSGAASRSGR